MVCDTCCITVWRFVVATVTFAITKSTVTFTIWDAVGVDWAGVVTVAYRCWWTNRSANWGDAWSSDWSSNRRIDRRTSWRNNWSRSNADAPSLLCGLVESLCTFTIVKGVVAHLIWDTEGIGGAHIVIVTWRDGWIRMVWHTAGSRFVIAMVASAIVKGIIAPAEWESVWVWGTNKMIVTKEEEPLVLKSKMKIDVGVVRYRYFYSTKAGWKFTYRNNSFFCHCKRDYQGSTNKYDWLHEHHFNSWYWMRLGRILIYEIYLEEWKNCLHRSVCA